MATKQKKSPAKKPSAAKVAQPKTTISKTKSKKPAKTKPTKSTKPTKATQPSKSKTIKAAKISTPKPANIQSGPRLSREARNWGMYTHLAAFAGFIIPFGNIIAPLIIWLTKREDYPFVDRQGKEALNFQISMTIYFFVAILLAFIIIGFILIPILVIVWIVCVIVASLKAQEGESYRYPFTIRFLT